VSGRGCPPGLPPGAGEGHAQPQRDGQPGQPAFGQDVQREVVGGYQPVLRQRQIGIAVVAQGQPVFVGTDSEQWMIDGHLQRAPPQIEAVFIPGAQRSAQGGHDNVGDKHNPDQDRRRDQQARIQQGADKVREPLAHSRPQQPGEDQDAAGGRQSQLGAARLRQKQGKDQAGSEQPQPEPQIALAGGQRPGHRERNEGGGEVAQQGGNIQGQGQPVPYRRQQPGVDLRPAYHELRRQGQPKVPRYKLDAAEHHHHRAHREQRFHDPALPATAHQVGEQVEGQEIHQDRPGVFQADPPIQSEERGQQPDDPGGEQRTIQGRDREAAPLPPQPGQPGCQHKCGGHLVEDAQRG